VRFPGMTLDLRDELFLVRRTGFETHSRNAEPCPRFLAARLETHP